MLPTLLSPGPNKGPSTWCRWSRQNETKFGSEAKESFIRWSENGRSWAQALERMLYP